MSLTKRDIAELRKRAICSLVLAIELFNRPHEIGRVGAVLIFLHHAFEMLLKAVIGNSTGTIHMDGGKYSYPFSKCLEITQCQLKMISVDERRVLSVLDAYRDTSVHFYQECSEDLLYVQAQAAVTLFNELLNRSFRQSLADIIPSRVLPISTRPPKDLHILIDSELSQVDDLLKVGKRKGPQAAARLRPILALTAATKDEGERVSEDEIHNALARRKRGEDWALIFPEVAQLRVDMQGEGIPIYFKIRKEADFPVRIATDGEPIIGTVLKQEINIWDKFNLGRDDLAQKLGLSGPKTSALLVDLKIQDDPDCFRTLRRKSVTFKGYSKKALDRLREALDNGLDIEAVWRNNRHLFGGNRNKTR